MDLIELAPRLHHLRFPIGNAYLWTGSGGLTLIDCGLPGSAPHIAEAIRALGHRPADLRHLILTHAHIDHVGSAAEIATWGEVTVYAHHDEAAFIKGEAEVPPPDIQPGWERDLFDQVHKNVPTQGPSPVRVDRELDDGDEIDLNGTAAIAVAAPGHTPGSLGLYLPEAQVLFTGDSIARGLDGAVILGVFNADRPQAKLAAQRLAELNSTVACFGHGDPVTEKAAPTLRTALL